MVINVKEDLKSNAEIRMEALGEVQPDINPFIAFPQEVWEVILENLDDSEDLLNVFTAFPQLTHLKSRHHFSWLISLVMPLIFPKYLNVAQMKSCRLACKRWNNSINDTIAYHPDRLPYKSTRLKRMTEMHSNYYKLPAISTDLYICGFRLDRLTLSTEKRGNPFPGRHVHLKVTSDRVQPGIRYDLLNSYSGHQHEANMDLCGAVPLLRHYGHHVWYITFEIRLSTFHDKELILSNVVQPFFQCLYYVPNLKSLKLKEFNFPAHVMVGKRNRFMEFIEAAAFPFRLETLDMCVWKTGDEFTSDYLQCNFTKAVVNHEKVRKLVIHSNSWKNHYSVLFPSLSELCVYSADSQTLQNILQELRYSPPQKLGIFTSGMTINDLLEVIVDWNGIEALELDGNMAGNYEIKCTKESCYSLRCNLSIQNSFRRCLLHFYGKAKKEKRANYFLKCLWERMPNLKVITVHKDGSCYKYTR